MGKAKRVRIDESLEKELKYIQEEMKKKLGDIDLSQPQASIIAAKLLNEKRSRIGELVVRKSRGKRAKGIFFT